MTHSYDGTKQNIPLISDRFFQKYFLSSFNKCTDSEQLRHVLTKLKHKLSSPQQSQQVNNTTNLQKFENNVLRLAYHSCIARCSFATDNDINNGQIDTVQY